MNKTNVATAERIEDIPAAPRVSPEIDPGKVTLESAGVLLRKFVVNLPTDFEASDLSEPTIWRRVQAGRSPLRQLDELVLIQADRSALWVAFTSEVTATTATLAKPTRHELRSRVVPYYTDDRFKIEWRDHGFCVVRREDSHVLVRALSSEAAALKHLQSYYAQKVA